MPLNKTLITIVADDGSNRITSKYTGLMEWANGIGIPWTLAVPSNAPSSSSGLSINELTAYVASGNEVIMHGQTTSDNYRTMTAEEIIIDLQATITWANTNGFSSNIFAYPHGLQVDDLEADDKMAALSSLGIEMAFNVNTAAESSSSSGYEDWYTYDNGKNGINGVGGTFNVVPFVTMPNGINKSMLLNRWEITRDNNIVKTSWWKSRLDEYISKNGYLVFFCHPHTSGYTTADDDGKTGADYFKDTIQYIIDNYSDVVEFVTPSRALEIINGDAPVVDKVEYFGKNSLNKLLELLKGLFDKKQDKLTAGTNITISGSTISAKDTTYTSKAAASGGTDVSLVTTGEKATWNDKLDSVNPTGTGSFSMNRKSGTTVGQYSHAEGNNTTASGHCSHAEGFGSVSSGNYSHAEGCSSEASGIMSHAEGCSEAIGDCSHAEGEGTIAKGDFSHVEGRNNIEDTEGKYAHILGNGSNWNQRSNAHTVDWDGNAWYSGDITLNAGEDATYKVVKANNTQQIGSAIKPVYVNSSGTATACTYELNKSVPSNAKFTDTTYSVATQSVNGLMSAADKKTLDELKTTIDNLELLDTEAF